MSRVMSCAYCRNECHWPHDFPHRGYAKCYLCWEDAPHTHHWVWGLVENGFKVVVDRLLDVVSYVVRKVNK